MGDEKRKYSELFGYFEFGHMDNEGKVQIMEQLIRTIEAAEKLGILITYTHARVNREMCESVSVSVSDAHENMIEIETKLRCESFSVDYLKDSIRSIKRKTEIQNANAKIEKKLLEEMNE